MNLLKQNNDEYLSPAFSFALHAIYHRDFFFPAGKKNSFQIHID
jgi:hypothetical protein